MNAVTAEHPDSQAPPQLHRELGALDATLLVVGIIIGSGIFLTTGVMAKDLPSGSLLMWVWAVGGLLTVAGALTFSELGAALPEAGGPYVYLREAYGPGAAFLFGWITLLVYQPGAIAAVAVGFAAYLGHFAPALGTEHQLVFTLASAEMKVSAGQVLAAVLILLLTAVNVQGLREGSRLQNLSTLLKLAALFAFVALGLVFGHKASRLPAEVPSRASLAGFGLALMAVLWAFDGWANLVFSAGEVREPERNIPRALALGTLLTTAIYLLVNLVYLRALRIDELQGVERVAEKAAAALFGRGLGDAIAVIVLVSTFGSTNGTILTGARVYYAMARDGLFFRSVGHVHPRHCTPDVALWLQGIWSAIVALSGRFDQLFTYCMFAEVLMLASTTAAVFRLRSLRPDLPRPYRVWGYPYMPALYLLALVVLAINTLRERPFESLAGLGLLAAGLPAYAFWRRQLQTAEAGSLKSSM